MTHQAPVEPKKKNWFARHKFLTAILIVVVLIIIGAMGASGEDEDTTTSSNNSSTNSSTDSGGSNTEESEDTETSDSDAAEDSKDDCSDNEEAEPVAADEEEPDEPDMPGIGSTVNTGNFDVTIHSVDVGVSEIGGDFLGAEASGQYVLVHVTVLNTSNEADYFHGSDQDLIDEQGRKHSRSSDSAYLSDTVTFSLEKINPGIALDGVLLYDIPADATPTSLELSSDDLFGDSILVSLE